MPDILSDWKVTFDPDGTPFLLVDWGQLIDDDVQFPWSQSVQTVDPIALASGKSFPRGGVIQEVVIGVYKDHVSQAAKNNYLLEMAASIPRSVIAPLQIEVRGGNTYRLPDAVWLRGDARTVKTSGKARSWVQHRLTGGVWAIYTPP